MTAALATDVEVWRPIEGVEGDYSVSSHGRVRNDRKGRLLKLVKFIGKTGKEYYIVFLKPIDGCWKQFLLHRLVATAFIENPELKPCVDHIDNNGLHNHISNLRWASRQENSRNRKKQLSSSPYKGVYWDKACSKWRASIKIDSKTLNLGLYDDPLEAHWVYCAAAVFYHGEFASDGT